MGLHDSRFAIHIDNQPGKPVALTVGKPENIVISSSYQPERPAKAESLGQTPSPKCGIDNLIVER